MLRTAMDDAAHRATKPVDPAAGPSGMRCARPLPRGTAPRRVSAAGRALAAAVAAGAWAAEPAAEPPAYSLQGDVRTRLELRDTSLPGLDESRLLLRARVSVEATLAPGLALGIGLTTGNPDDSRVADAVLGDGAAKEPVRLDLAWIAWRPEAAPGLALTAGRMAMPLLCVQDLVYDGDWRPSGLTASWSPPREGWRPHLRAAAFWLTESEGENLRLYAAQAAAEWRRGVEWRFLGGAGLHAVDGAAGQPPPLDDASAAGNTLCPADPAEPDSPAVLAEDYRPLEAFAQLTWDPWFPITVYGQAVCNTAAGDDNDGWVAGLTLGRARAVGALELGWNLRRLEKDAVLSALADSDFGGGGTDVEGHKVYARYHVLKDLLAGVTWFDGLRDPGGRRLRETLWQFDLTVRF